MKKIISIIAVIALIIGGVLIYKNIQAGDTQDQVLRLQESDAIQLVSEQFDTSKYAFEIKEKKKIGENEYIIVEVKLNGEGIEPYVAVDDVTGELKTYYAADSIKDFSEFPMEKPAVERQDWNGEFEENGNVEGDEKKLGLMQADDNSFEFTFEVKKNDVDETFTGVARISENRGLYTGENGFEINFVKDGNSVEVVESGKNPIDEAGIFFAGEYRIND